jgi:hypothetical protein
MSDHSDIKRDLFTCTYHNKGAVNKIARDLKYLLRAAPSEDSEKDLKQLGNLDLARKYLTPSPWREGQLFGLSHA